MAQGREKAAAAGEAAGDVAGSDRSQAGPAAGEQKAERGSGGGGGGGGVSPAGGSPAWADLDFVRGLIEVVDSSGIDSLEISRSGTRIKISKTPPAGGGPMYYAPSPYPSAPPSMPAIPAGPAGAPGANAAAAAGEGGGDRPPAATDVAAGSTGTGADTGLVEVKSPMVGTFYRAPAPEAPPYVEVGTRVSKGQTLCIIEAMKLMNEMESEIEGVVRQVLVDNSEPVEYGQVLFRIDPNG